MRELYLPCGRVALVSDVDHDRCRKHKWYAHSNNSSNVPYVRTTIQGKTVYLHRFITDAPPTMKVDHEDTDTFNNQRPNLRIATFDRNNLNRSFWSVSGFKGVSFDKGKYRARIQLGGEVETLGRFSSAIEAAQAYDDRAHKLFGEFAWLNFPERFPVPQHDIPEPPEIPF